LAVIGIWVVEQAVHIAPSLWVGSQDQDNVTVDTTLLVLGFAIGVFPRVAWQVVQAVLKRVGAFALPSLRTQLPLSDLDGLTVWHEARLEEEDVENIPNMATADLIDLMINTRFPPDHIIDWIDQAILYTHIGPEQHHTGFLRQTNNVLGWRGILRVHGIRNASSLVEIYNRSELHKDQEAFERILSGEALEKIQPKDSRQPVRSLVDAMGTNPNLKLIQTWRGLSPHSH